MADNIESFETSNGKIVVRSKSKVRSMISRKQRTSMVASYIVAILLVTIMNYKILCTLSAQSGADLMASLWNSSGGGYKL